MERQKFIVTVYLLFIKDEKILLLRRYNTGWQDGNYSVPAGHVENQEAATTAAMRECLEETGVIVNAEDLDMVYSMHRVEPNRFEFFFKVKEWSGEIKNNEPHKCDDLSWFRVDNLPENMVPSVKKALEDYLQGRNFSIFLETE